MFSKGDLDQIKLYTSQHIIVHSLLPINTLPNSLHDLLPRISIRCSSNDYKEENNWKLFDCKLGELVKRTNLVGFRQKSIN